MSTAIYTTNRLTSIDDVDGATAAFILRAAEAEAKLFDHKFNWRHFDYAKYMRNNLFLVCYKNGDPVGAMLARLHPSIFDHEVMILYQDLLYVEPGNLRAAHKLMRCFIEFGRENADHIFTMTTKNTNIKGQSLEKLGFEGIEVLYRMEV